MNLRNISCIAILAISLIAASTSTAQASKYDGALLYFGSPLILGGLIYLGVTHGAQVGSVASHIAGAAVVGGIAQQATRMATPHYSYTAPNYSGYATRPPIRAYRRFGD